MPPPEPPPGGGRKKFGFFRRFVVRPFFWFLAVLALLALAVVALLRSDFLRERSRALLVAQLHETTRRDVRVGDVRFSLMPLSLDIADLAIAGRDAADPPLVAVDSLHIAGEWEGLSGRVLRLTEVVVERPRVDLLIYPDGSTNLPDFGGGGERGSLEIRVDALLVHAGTFHFNAQEIPLELAASQIHARLVRAKRGNLRGDALVERVDLSLPNARTIPVAVSGSVLLGASGIEIENGRARTPGFAATASGPIGWGAANRGELRFAADGSTAVLRELGYIEDQVSAESFHADGSVWWGPPQAAAHGAVRSTAAVKRWGVAGTVKAPHADLLGRQVEGLIASATVDEDGVRAELLDGTYHGGAVRGQMTIGLGDDTYPSDLRVRVEGADAGPLLREQGVPFEGLAGKVSGDFAYRFTFKDGVHGSGGGKAHVALAPPGPRQVSLAGDAAVTIDRGVLTIDALDLASSTQHLVGGGRLDFESGAGGFDFSVDTQDVGGLVPALPVTAPQLWLPSDGRGTVSAHLALAPPAALQTTLRFALQSVVAPGLRADEARGELLLGERAVEGLRLEATAPGRTLTVVGRVPIADPTASDPARLDLHITAHGWPLAEARPWLPADVAAIPLTGPFSGEVSLAGPLAALTGSVEGDVMPAQLAGVDAGHLRAKLDFDAQGMTLQSLVAALPAGDVRATGTLLFADQRLALQVRAPTLELDQAPLAGLLGQLRGSIELNADVGGTLAEPEVKGGLLGHDLALLEHEIGDHGASRFDFDWRGDRLDARGSLLGLVDVEGGGALSRDQADLAFALHGETLPRWLEAATGSAIPELAGGFAGTLTVRGAFSAASGAQPLEARLELPDLHARLGDLAVTNREPARATWSGGRLRIESLWLGDAQSEADAVLAGSLGFGAADRIDLKFQSSLPGRWVTAFLPGVQVTGGLDLLATLRGTTAKPQFNGQGALRGARVIVLGFPHAIEDLTATVAIEPTRLVIDTLSAKLGGGQIVGSGTVDLPGGAAPGDYRFQLIAKGVQLRYPEGFVLRGDAELAIAPTETGRVIRGVVDLDRVYYLTDLKLGPTQLLRRLLQKQRMEVGETDEFLAGTALNIAVRAPGAVRVRNNVANLRGGLDLSLRGTLAGPVVFGRLELDPAGTVRYGDNDYELDRAVILFTNPYRIEPVLDIVAHTTVDAYKVKLSLSGTLDRLKPVFSSDPPIPENEVLGLLATGQAATPGTATPTNDLTQGTGAEAFLYGQAASLVGQRVGNLFGLDSFRVEPLTGAAATLSSVRVTVGKRLRRDLYVTYSVDPSGTQEQIFKVEWQVRPELALVLTQNGDGSYALDARWEKSF